MELTAHARVRCQQRGIPPLIVEWLLEYGTEAPSHGATKRYFDRTARRRLSKAVGHEVVDRLGDLLNHYLVEDEGRVITASQRRRPLRRP